MSISRILFCAALIAVPLQMHAAPQAQGGLGWPWSDKYAEEKPDMDIKNDSVHQIEVSPWTDLKAEKSQAMFRHHIGETKPGEWFGIHTGMSDTLHFTFRWVKQEKVGMLGFAMRRKDRPDEQIFFVYRPGGGWYVVAKAETMTRFKFTSFDFKAGSPDKLTLGVEGLLR